MKKAVRIGSIDLDYKLQVAEELRSVKNTATTRRTVAGALVVYEQENRSTALSVTLDSGQHGWQKRATVEAIIALSDSLAGKTTTVEYDDGSSESVRFAYEQRGGAVQSTPLYEGAEWYRVKIYMGRA